MLPWGRPRTTTNHEPDMRSCWKCALVKVPDSDDLGLCAGCIEMMRDPEYMAREPVKMSPTQQERERIERLEREMAESG